MLLVFNPAETAKPPHDPALPVPAARRPRPRPRRLRRQRRKRSTAGATRLTAAGVAIEADFRWPNGARSIYVRDPAGNSVEFAEPRLWDFSTSICPAITNAKLTKMNTLSFHGTPCSNCACGRDMP